MKLRNIIFGIVGLEVVAGICLILYADGYRKRYNNGYENSIKKESNYNFSCT